MKLIVFSSPDKLHSEIDTVINMFREGLEYFHLRKPKFSSKELDEYLELIPNKYRNRIILHTHHKLAKKYNLKGLYLTRVHRTKKYNTNFKMTLFRLKYPTSILSRSCHHLQALTESPKRYNYLFLSPVYEGISSNSHAGQFSMRGIKKALSQSDVDVIAMGGVDESKFEEIAELGFKGVGLLGCIWKSEDPVKTFISARDKLEEIDLHVTI